jgi:sulfur relay protein TusB/DsrH
MLVIIKSAPDTPEGKRGVQLACDTSAAVVLLQNGVYFMQGQKFGDAGFAGKVYVLEDDRQLRGLEKNADSKNMQDINYDIFVDLMIENDKVIGMF